MKNYGFIRLAAAICTSRPGDVTFNTSRVRNVISEAYKKGVSVITFPELFITGSTCGDLSGNSLLINEAEKGIKEIAEATRGKEMAVVAGVPVSFEGRLYNCAAVIRNGNIKGIVPKIFINTAERRWFSSGKDFLTPDSIGYGILLDNGKDCFRSGFGGEICYAGQVCNISPNMLFEIGGTTFSVEIGEDLTAQIQPSSYHTLAGATIVVNPAAFSETEGRNRFRDNLLKQHSLKTLSAYVHSSAKGESTQDTVYAGAGSIWECGDKLASSRLFSEEDELVIADIDIERISALRMKSESFYAVSPDGTPSASYRNRYSRLILGRAYGTDFEEKLYRHIEPHPFAPSAEIDRICRESLEIQVNALCGRLAKIQSKAVIGISGGLDSTLALLVTALAFDKLKSGDDIRWSRENIVAVTMPGFGTTSRTKGNAWDLMEALGVSCREIPIGPAVKQHFNDIGHDASVHDATYENSQARERTQILMDIANQEGGIVIGTGDLSELALGWATYNGDHMSMYGVNAGIPKTLVQNIVRWAAENRFNEIGETGRSVKDILLDIIDTPISPELLPASDNDEIQQVTEDLVGPYELHDFFIYNFMKYGYSPEKIFFLARKAFQQEKTIYDDQTIQKWLKTFISRFFSQQFKRSCMPDGPQVGEISLSPRGGWSMPSDIWSTLYQNNI